MSTLRDIQKRIRSVVSVEQITKAMEMVAAACLRRAQTKAEQSHRYAAQLTRILDHLASSSCDVSHPFFTLRTVKKTGIIIVAADKGLCGSYNTNIFSAADKLLKNYSQDQVDLILIGRKAVSHYRHRHWKIRHQISPWGGKITFPQIKELTNQLVQWYTSGELDEILLVYTHFVSILKREIIQEKFLGFGKPQQQKKSLNYIFEPDAQSIYDELLPRYCISKIQTILDEAYASELAARAFSMRKANRNANEMLKELILVRNKIRQADITREMIEIATGAEGIR